MRNLDGLPAYQRLQAARQIVGLRQACSVDKDGDNPNAAFDGSLDLDSNEVVRIVETTSVVRICRRDPMFSDDGDERVALADPHRKRVDEINAGRDAVHVEKDVLASQRSPQAVIYPAGEPTGVLPTVGNENPAKHGFSLRSRKLTQVTSSRNAVKVDPTTTMSANHAASLEGNAVVSFHNTGAEYVISSTV